MGTSDPAVADMRVTTRRVLPTDIAQFIRLGFCERFMRLQLVLRSSGQRVFADQGTPIQPISPLLTVSGRRFEHEVETALAQFSDATQCGEPVGSRSRRDNHAEIFRALNDVEPGRRQILFQPRLHVPLGEWDMRGDADVMLIERDAQGAVSVLVADIKSSTAPKVEHRLQVAFYVAMLTELWRSHRQALPDVRLGIIFKGPADLSGMTDPEQRQLRESQAAAFRSVFGTGDSVGRGHLEIVADSEAYLEAARDLVFKPDSRLEQIAERPFDDLSFEYGWLCDGCYFNRACLKRATLQDDVALLPYVSAQDRLALRRGGVTTLHNLAALPAQTEVTSVPSSETVWPAPPDLIPPISPKELEVQRVRLVGDRQIGARLDELIARARTQVHAMDGAAFRILPLPSGGDGTLPRVAPDQHPNLVWVYLDVQRDYIQDRLYLLGAKVVGCEQGEPDPTRQRTVVAFSDRPPEDAATEGELLKNWVKDVLAAIAEVVADDPEQEPRTAPIHLVFFSEAEQQALLDGLARHFGDVFGATALYDFVTQLPAFDSPIASIVATEIRQRHLIPVVPQSLYRLSQRLGFKWDTPYPFREWFRERIFDWTSVLRPTDHPGKATSPSGGDAPNPQYYIGRARFGSGLPLEYAYGAWGELRPDEPGNRRELEAFVATTPDRMVAFERRRLDALEYLVARLRPNRNANKRGFHIPDLSSFQSKASDLGQALQEFMIVERHVALQSWKGIRQNPPEQRMLAGHTLVVEYRDADQTPDVQEQMREGRRRYARLQAIRAGQTVQDDGKYPPLSAEEKKETQWPHEGLRVRVRVHIDDAGVNIEELLLLSDLQADDWVVLSERWTTSTKPGEPTREPYTPTARQLLWAPRATLVQSWIDQDSIGNPIAWVELELTDQFRGRPNFPFVFGSGPHQPLEDGRVYTIDKDPNDSYGQQNWETVQEIVGGKQNTLFDRLVSPEAPTCSWPPAAAEGQRRFYAGLAELERRAALHGFEPSKQEFIAEHGSDGVLLVQGPPGTGKSYTTGFALFARLQGAMQAGLPYHIAAGCKTHAATDVLMSKMVEIREQLRPLARAYPDVFARYFDQRLLEIPIYRLRPRTAPPPRVIPLYDKKDRNDVPAAAYRFDPFSQHQWTFVASTPGGIRALDRAQKDHSQSNKRPFTCLVLDEASQMNLPESLMAARLLAPDGQLIVVGDHRQMPPIVNNDWESERRRTFWEYRSYASLFDTLRLRVPRPPLIQFAESFRLHADLAEFLRREIYQQDGIAYFSRRRGQIPSITTDDPFVKAVLHPSYPLVLVVHDEDRSQTRNDFERELIEPVIQELVFDLGFQPNTGFGVVVPHRAQRAAIQHDLSELGDAGEDGQIDHIDRAVDTVERFQGGEREVMIFGATESEPGYLINQGEFLFDPRRMTVALSRAKDKLILVASQAVFDLFHADEQVFANLQLWKRLRRSVCTIELWSGERAGHHVSVYGNVPLVDEADEVLGLTKIPEAMRDVAGMDRTTIAP